MVSAAWEAVRVIDGSSEDQRHYHAHIRGRHQQPCHRIGLCKCRGLAVDAGKLPKKEGSHPQHGLHETLEDRAIVSQLVRLPLPSLSFRATDPIFSPKFLSAARGEFSVTVTFSMRNARAVSKARVSGIQRFDMDAFEQAQSDQLGKAARVVTRIA